MKKEKKYFQGIGRRKNATAIVKLFPKERGIFINKRDLKDYFPEKEYQKIVLDPFSITGLSDKFRVEILVSGGGKTGQSEAIRLGISRALCLFKPNLKPTLKKSGFLKRDPRKKERKKPGLKKARRAPQWQKR